MALAVLSSCRPTVLPRIAKPLRFTAPDTADALSMNSLGLICEYQSPAPSIVTPLTCSAEPMRKVPDGVHTGSPAVFARETAVVTAGARSVGSVGAAAELVTAAVFADSAV